MTSVSASLDAFLVEFPITPPEAEDNWVLARDLCSTYLQLATHSSDQFIPTPLLESNLPTGQETGRCLAIDIGGSNLRVGVIELLSPAGDRDGAFNDTAAAEHPGSSTMVVGNTIHKSFEMSWHIEESLKNGSPESLFSWIGKCMAEVIGHERGFPDNKTDDVLLVGVTFSFPMIQDSLTEARIMSMSKGYTLSTDLGLGYLLVEGYEKHRMDQDTRKVPAQQLPKLKIAAIVNDAVATFVTTNYQMKTLLGKKVHMSFICATGGNATVSMPIKNLGNFKVPGKIVTEEALSNDLEIIVNTEWAMRGGSVPIQTYITRWDLILDKDLPIPGQQPFDYMTAGRYLGELARIMAVDFFTTIMHIEEVELPPLLTQRNGVTTAVIGKILNIQLENPMDPGAGQFQDSLTAACQEEIPQSGGSKWQWTYETAMVLCRITSSILNRATMLMASSIVGLMLCIGSLKSEKALQSLIPYPSQSQRDTVEEKVLAIGYTGGCIMHFPHYLSGVEDRVNRILKNIQDEHSAQQMVFVPVNDGGILGAGILACKAGRDRSLGKD